VSDTLPGSLGYVRPVEAADPPLDATVQRTAVRAFALGEGLAPIEVYEESSPDGRLAYAHLLQTIEERRDAMPAGPPLVLATLRVLGESAVERAWRLTLLCDVAEHVAFADRAPAEEALHADWAARSSGERRRERAREGMRARALRGIVLGRPPFGYAVEERTLTPHPRYGDVVKRMFREYVDDGLGFRRIAAGLNRDGIRSRLGRPWTPGSVRTVLQNPVYTGLYRRLGVVVPAAHPALVDRATFHVAQRKMGERRTSRSRQQRHEYLFSGLLRCGQCRGAMVGERRAGQDGAIVSYRCLNASGRGTCRARGHREDRIVIAVREELGRLDQSGPIAFRETAGPDPESARERHERQFVELLERWHAGQWRFDEFVARASPAATALHRLELPADQPPLDVGEAQARLVEEWDNLPPGERTTLLRAVVAEVVVSGDDIRVTRRR
jgi:site-specific DNA recombinase